MTEKNRLLQAMDVAEKLSCSVRNVYRLADSGRLPKPIKVGSLNRWRCEDIEQWIECGGSVCNSVRITFLMIEAHQRGDIESRDTLLERLHDEFGITLHFADELETREGGAK